MLSFAEAVQRAGLPVRCYAPPPSFPMVRQCIEAHHTALEQFRYWRRTKLTKADMLRAVGHEPADAGTLSDGEVIGILAEAWLRLRKADHRDWGKASHA